MYRKKFSDLFWLFTFFFVKLLVESKQNSLKHINSKYKLLISYLISRSWLGSGIRGRKMWIRPLIPWTLLLKQHGLKYWLKLFLPDVVTCSGITWQKQPVLNKYTNFCIIIQRKWVLGMTFWYASKPHPPSQSLLLGNGGAWWWYTDLYE